MALGTTFHTRLSGQHSLFLGIVFIAAGVLVAALALGRYLAIERDIEAGVVMPRRGLIYGLVAVAVASGLLLIAYLGYSWPTQ
jgi:uncharacterized membrane protein YidH (DUF202 family)